MLVVALDNLHAPGTEASDATVTEPVETGDLAGPSDESRLASGGHRVAEE
jgi:hypothetical protein